MEYFYIIGICAVAAFVAQSFMGFQQIKHFSKTYSMLRKKGRVAIGRKAGKIRSGTIVMLCIDQENKIIQACRMQGTTVFAKFKDMEDFCGISIESLTIDTPCVMKENKLIRKSIMDAVETYYKVQRGEEIAEKKAPISQLGAQIGALGCSINKKIRRSA